MITVNHIEIELKNSCLVIYKQNMYDSIVHYFFQQTILEFIIFISTIDICLTISSILLKIKLPKLYDIYLL